MFVRTSVLIFLFVLASQALWGQQNPIIGTWKINLAKSKSNLGPPPVPTLVNKFEPSGANGVKYTSDRVNAQGEPVHFEFTANFDGKDYPSQGTTPGQGVTGTS